MVHSSSLIPFQGTTWPQHRYDISITHQQQFLQQQRHDNSYNKHCSSSSTRTTATGTNGSNFKAKPFYTTQKHKENRRQQQQQQPQHYASQHKQEKEQQQKQQQQQQQQRPGELQQMMHERGKVIKVHQPGNGPHLRSLPQATITECCPQLAAGKDSHILWHSAAGHMRTLLPLLLLLLLQLNSSHAWLWLLWPPLQGLLSRLASAATRPVLAYHAYLPMPVKTLRNHNESSSIKMGPRTAPALARRRTLTVLLPQSASSWICRSLHALYFRLLSSSICCPCSMQIHIQIQIQIQAPSSVTRRRRLQDVDGNGDGDGDVGVGQT
ncbi:GL23442 [Drosophila persimilis]|uniref:GL23442 n=1 Tax=Drosophila persimilis TaxID=7234 RepID=B4G3N8_DROPE|nr:GL23442 [Drosophila persimilis]